MKRILFSLLIAAPILLAACGGQGTPPVNLTCDYTYELTVTGDGYQVVPYRDYSVTTTATWQGPDEDGYYNLVPNDMEAINAVVAEVNADTEIINRGLAQLYVNYGFLEAPTYNTIGEPGGFPISSDPSCDPRLLDDGWQWNLDSPLENAQDDHGYVTETRIGATDTFVKVTTPEGSKLSYSYPTEYLAIIFASAFDGGPELVLTPEIVVPELNPADASDYTSRILKDMVTSNQNGREALAFTLNIEDFEGRQQIKAVMAQALLVAAAQEDRPVMATLHAMLTSGQKAVGSASASGGFSLNGMFILGTGGVDGGGYFQSESTYSSWFEDLLKGSIYITPVE